MEVRPAEPTDAEAIAEVFVAAREATMPYLPELHTHADIRRWIHDVVLAQSDVWLAEEDGVAVGFAALGPNVLEHLYIAPDHLRMGVGTKLLEVAKRERPEGFELWIFQKNERARRFYEHHGLELVELTDGSGNEEREPDARYAWRP